MAKRLLISYAHPDDESFGLGGLIARYVEEGVEVYVLCATNGDRGTVKPEMLNGYGSIAERRLAELDCAAETLRLTRVIKLGYKDSGMMGSESTKDPDCLWQAPQEEVTRRVVEVIREIRPQVVITFNRYGGYGHPDHIAIQRATTAAFTLAGDPTYLTDGLAPYQPQKLYYSGFPKALMQIGIWTWRLKGKDPRRLGKNGDINLQAVLDNAEPYHAMVDISRYYEVWDKANRCHQSQLGGSTSPFPMWLRKILLPGQGFTRVHPKPAQDRIDEDDLFAGVQVDERVPVP